MTSTFDPENIQLMIVNGTAYLSLDDGKNFMRVEASEETTNLTYQEERELKNLVRRLASREIWFGDCTYLERDLLIRTHLAYYTPDGTGGMCFVPTSTGAMFVAEAAERMRVEKRYAKLKGKVSA